MKKKVFYSQGRTRDRVWGPEHKPNRGKCHLNPYYNLIPSEHYKQRHGRKIPENDLTLDTHVPVQKHKAYDSPRHQVPSKRYQSCSNDPWGKGLNEFSGRDVKKMITMCSKRAQTERWPSG